MGATLRSGFAPVGIFALLGTALPMGLGFGLIAWINGDNWYVIQSATGVIIVFCLVAVFLVAGRTYVRRFVVNVAVTIGIVLIAAAVNEGLRVPLPQ